MKIFILSIFISISPVPDLKYCSQFELHPSLGIVLSCVNGVNEVQYAFPIKTDKRSKSCKEIESTPSEFKFLTRGDRPHIYTTDKTPLYRRVRGQDWQFNTQESLEHGTK